MGVGSTLVRLGNPFIRFLQLCISVAIVGIYGWYIAVLVSHDAPIARHVKAVAGLAALAAIYTLFGVLLSFFLGGMMFFAMLAVALDVCFVASFIAIAIMARGSHGSCKGHVNTPIGSGPSDSSSPGYGRNGFGFGGRYKHGFSPNLGLACRTQKAVLALAIIGLFLFMCSIVIQLLQARNRKREKSSGPSHANGYASNHEKKFWKRSNHHDAEHGVPKGGANGRTAAGANGAAGGKPGFWKFGRHHQGTGAANGGYPNGVPGYAAQPQQQTATYGAGAGGTGAGMGTGTVPAGGGQGYSYVNSAPGYNVQQTAAQAQYGAGNY